MYIDKCYSLRVLNFKVATLTTKFDLVDTELRAAKSQTNWVDSNFTDVQELATQLDEQKLALQRQISDQAQEIESLNEEVKCRLSLVSSITRLVHKYSP